MFFLNFLSILGSFNLRPDKREQRKIDQAKGLVPFALKLDGELVKQIQALAQERKTGLNEVVAELLKKGLES